MVELGLNDRYRVARLQTLVLSPAYTSEAYEWRMGDSVVGRAHDYVFCQPKSGTYDLELRLLDSLNPLLHPMQIEVIEEPIAYSPYLNRVYEYCPAPGQFVGEMPTYEAGDNEPTMLQKAQCIAGEKGTLISLGGFGGYVTFGFDHAVWNELGQRDFQILGNAYYAIGSDTYGSSEPGIVMVSIDRNNNALPDDEWYELAGSEYHATTTLHHYQITYRKEGDQIVWDDNQGSHDTIRQNAFHSQDYFPLWKGVTSLTFEGTLLASQTQLEGTTYRQRILDFGYADNRPNQDTIGTSFDISWAVNDQGEQVFLPCINFVRVYTGVNEVCGWAGELSTEVAGAKDLHL